MVKYITELTILHIAKYEGQLRVQVIILDLLHQKMKVGAVGIV